MPDKVESIVASIGMDNSGLRRDVDNANGLTDQMLDAFKRMGHGIVVATSKSAKEVKKDFEKINKSVDKSEKEFEKFKKGVQKELRAIQRENEKLSASNDKLAKEEWARNIKTLNKVEKWVNKEIALKEKLISVNRKLQQSEGAARFKDYSSYNKMLNSAYKDNAKFDKDKLKEARRIAKEQRRIDETEAKFINQLRKGYNKDHAAAIAHEQSLANKYNRIWNAAYLEDVRRSRAAAAAKSASQLSAQNSIRKWAMGGFAFRGNKLNQLGPALGAGGGGGMFGFGPPPAPPGPQGPGGFGKSMALPIVVGGFKKMANVALAMASAVTGAFKAIYGVISSVTRPITSLLQGIIRHFIMIGTYAAIAGAIFYTKFAAKVAMDAIEIDNLFKVVFGDMTASADAWAKSFSRSSGLFETDIKDAMAKMNFFVQNLKGLSPNTMLAWSEDLTKFGIDLASLFNLDIDTAFAKIKSGMAGQIRPLQQLGILVDLNTIKQTMWSKGLVAQGKDLTAQEKIMGRYITMMEAAKKIHDDWLRTMNQPANVVRRIGQAFKAVSKNIGMSIVKRIFGSEQDIIEGKSIAGFTLHLLEKLRDMDFSATLKNLSKAFTEGHLTKEIFEMVWAGMKAAWLNTVAFFKNTVMPALIIIWDDIKRPIKRALWTAFKWSMLKLTDLFFDLLAVLSSPKFWQAATAALLVAFGATCLVIGSMLLGSISAAFVTGFGIEGAVLDTLKDAFQPFWDWMLESFQNLITDMAAGFKNTNFIDWFLHPLDTIDKFQKGVMASMYNRGAEAKDRKKDTAFRKQNEITDKQSAEQQQKADLARNARKPFSEQAGDVAGILANLWVESAQSKKERKDGDVAPPGQKPKAGESVTIDGKTFYSQEAVDKMSVIKERKRAAQFGMTSKEYLAASPAVLQVLKNNNNMAQNTAFNANAIPIGH